jgi:hypothetical protein
MTLAINIASRSPRWVFGFGEIFVITQMHGLGLKLWAALLVLAAHIGMNDRESLRDRLSKQGELLGRWIDQILGRPSRVPVPVPVDRRNQRGRRARV